MEDDEIVELFFERSEEAVLETGRKYGVYLRSLVFNILHDVNDAEEIVNDTYMAAWSAIPPTKPGNFKYWLSRVARNLSFDRLDYRNAGKRHALVVELDECIPDMKGGPQDIWEAKEIGRILNEFLRDSDRKSCAVFLARYYYAQPIKEVAQWYGLTERQVKYRLSVIRKELKLYLQKEGVAV